MNFVAIHRTNLYGLGPLSSIEELKKKSETELKIGFDPSRWDIYEITGEKFQVQPTYKLVLILEDNHG